MDTGKKSKKKKNCFFFAHIASHQPTEPIVTRFNTKLNWLSMLVRDQVNSHVFYFVGSRRIVCARARALARPSHQRDNMKLMALLLRAAAGQCFRLDDYGLVYATCESMCVCVCCDRVAWWHG